MTYTAPATPRAYLPMINTFSEESLGVYGTVMGASLASATFPATNRTLYVPFWPFKTVTALRLFCLNGSTVGTNTITMGLYSADSSGLPATRIVTANATSAGANACQFFNITDTSLTGGLLYYVAVAMNGTTATLARFAPTLLLLDFMMFQDASNCPDPAVPAIPASAYVPLVGIDFRGAP